MKRLLLFVCSLIFAGLVFGQDAARLMRFPAIHGDQVVFSYAGDLYTVSRAGGTARKLTSFVGYEMFSKFSPDGKHIAFTGQYDGNTEVFLMPSRGGIPKRLTYTATLGRDNISDRMGPNNIVMGWNPDGKSIIYRSRKQSFNSFIGQLFSISVDGGLSEEIPLPRGGFCSYSPDGQKLAYNRVFREFRTWKYYQGGMADDIWIYDFNTKNVANITENDAQDIEPMWYGTKIYFLSDRDRIMNIFVYDTETEETRKVTNFTNYDVKFPSLGDNAIAFERGGYLYWLDLETETVHPIPVQIGEDFVMSRPELKDVSSQVYTYEIAPDGKRALFSARGDIWTVPAEHGITRNLTKSSGVHDRNPLWSPDGKYIAYISDATGEYEIYIINQDGNESPIQLTDRADTYKYRLRWSPDSKKLIFSDKKLRLQYIDIDSKKVTLIEKSDIWEFNSFDWSPDSKWITYAQPQQNGMTKVCIYNLDDNKTFDITQGWYSSGDPIFSKDGKYIFFNSNRDYDLIYSRTEWNHAIGDMGRIYLVTLAKETPSPFAPENDEVAVKEDKKEEGDKENKEKSGDNEEKSDDIKVDIDGIQDRIIALPVEVANYGGLQSTGTKLYYNYYSSSKGSSTKVFDLKSQKETDLNFKGGFEISADGEKMLVGTGAKYAIIDLPSSKIKPDKYLDLSNMKAMVNYHEEWDQIFDESWRQMRDFFYMEDMHGVNWEAMKEKYSVMLPYVNNRNDLNYLIGEMIGELSVGHAYVNGGDLPKPERIKMGLLGAELSRDNSGYYRIDKILKGENWRRNLKSPLTEVGIDISEGDYIIAVDGISTSGMINIYSALVNTAGEQVKLTINSSADENGSRDVLIIPISNESKLYYFNWVQDNIRKVNEATDGQVGYIHVPDMGPEGLTEFVKYFYPQLTKKALIIDDRGNGGGNVSPMLIERLRREITRSNMVRNATIPTQTPRQMMLGPKVMLINQYSASDGDLFPYSFKKHQMGTVIGTRTWGGVVGIRGSLPFIDGGALRKPEFASYSSDESKWIIEGIGVEPDIWVRNDPAREYAGTDDQLNKAIEVIMEQLKEYEGLPDIPDGPDKSR